MRYLNGEQASAKASVQEAETGLSLVNDLTTRLAELEAQKANVVSLRSEHSACELAHARLAREEELSVQRVQAIEVEVARWTERSELAHEHIKELETRISSISSDLTNFKDLPDEIKSADQVYSLKYRKQKLKGKIARISFWKLMVWFAILRRA